MLEILLVFMVSNGPLEISDRIFNSHTECEEFVNAVAGMEVVEDDYTFRFITDQGMLFEGECVSMKKWFFQTGKTEI